MNDTTTRHLIIIAGMLAKGSGWYREATITRPEASLAVYDDPDHMTKEEFSAIIRAGNRASIEIDGDEHHGLWTFEEYDAGGMYDLVLSGALFGDR